MIFMGKLTVEDCKILSVREVLKGVTNPETIRDRDLVEYVTIVVGINGWDGKFDQRIGFVQTPTQFNGFRVWFKCPHCTTKVNKIYSPQGRYPFACRKCYRLDYELHLKGKTKRYSAIKCRKAEEKYFKTHGNSKKYEKRRNEWLFWRKKRDIYLIEMCMKTSREFEKITSRHNIGDIKDDCYQNFNPKRRERRHHPAKLIGMCSKLGWW